MEASNGRVGGSPLGGSSIGPPGVRSRPRDLRPPLHRSPAPALDYPATNAIFHDPELLAEERETLFEDGWVLAGMMDQLGGPGSHFVYEAEGRSVLVTLDEDGELHAFVNACTHRGTRLCAAAGQGRIQCPYHGWVFGHDGRLVRATRAGGLAPCDPADLGLHELAAERMGAFVFVHGRADAKGSLRDWLADLAPHLERVSESVGTLLFEVRLPIEANWKLAVSGGLEDYHAPWVHSGAVSRVQPGEADTTVAPHGHSWFQLTAPMPKRLRRLLPFLLGQRPPQVLESYGLFPNVTVVSLWCLVQVSNWVPVAPDRTLRITRWYAPTPPGTRRLAMRVLAWVARRRSLRIMVEDQQIVAEAHRGTAVARSMRRGPAHAQELRVEHLLAEVARRLGRRHAGATGPEREPQSAQESVG